MTSGRQWAALGVATFARFAGAILMGTALAVVVEARASAFAAGLVGTAYYAGLMLFSPFWGALADITGRRRQVLIVTGVGGVLAIIPLLVADTVAVAIASRGVYTAFLAGFAPVALAIVSHHGGTTGRGRSIGIFNSSRSGGFALGYVVAGGLLEYVHAGRHLLGRRGGDVRLDGCAGLRRRPDALSGREPDRSRDTGGDPTAALPGAGRADPPDPERPAVALRRHGAAQRRCAGHHVRRGAVPRHRRRCLAGADGRPAGVQPRLAGRVHVRARRRRRPRRPQAAGRRDGRQLRLRVHGSRVDRRSARPAPPRRGGRDVRRPGWVVLGDDDRLAGLRQRRRPFERESELLGIRETAKGLGGVVGPTLVGGVATLYSYELAFAGASAVGFAAAGLVAWGLVETYDSETRSVVVE